MLARTIFMLASSSSASLSLCFVERVNGLRLPPVFQSQCQPWLRRMRYCQVDVASLSNDICSSIFTPHNANSSQFVVAAHILVVADVCQLQRWFLKVMMPVVDLFNCALRHKCDVWVVLLLTADGGSRSECVSGPSFSNIS